MKILITDDERIMREELKDALDRVSPGNSIDFAGSYDEATQKIRTDRYDVAFCDIQMPGQNGLALAQTLKRLSPTTNIIMVTAYAEYALDAFRLFASGYLLKPVKDRELEAALNNLRNPVPQPEKQLTARCFGTFEIFYEGKPLVFQRQRSKELLAYLICLRGSSASRENICDALFEEAGTMESRAQTFKSIVHSLRKTLEKYGFDDLLIHSRNRYSIEPGLLQCDYFDYVTGKHAVPPATDYQGEFMTQFSWAERFVYMLETIQKEGVENHEE